MEVDILTVFEVIVVIAAFIIIVVFFIQKGNTNEFVEKQAQKYDKIIKKQAEMDKDIVNMQSGLHAIRTLLELRVTPEELNRDTTDQVIIRRTNGFKLEEASDV